VQRRTAQVGIDQQRAVIAIIICSRVPCVWQDDGVREMPARAHRDRGTGMVARGRKAPGFPRQAGRVGRRCGGSRGVGLIDGGDG